MALAGAWKRETITNGEAFFANFPVDPEKLKRATQADLVTDITDAGNTVTIKRTYTLGG